ncbi:serine protease [Syncephalastrum racemosum]|uniref:Serine protease n=1 Tax=Syncephalastrum racemosum TaxID=13706 RepID=A0A1X2H3H5_SYNRA|nr:serine protease [Syncephalastrum racemosum]
MRVSILSSAIVLLAGYVTAFPTFDYVEDTLAPLFHSPNSYIVVLKDHVDTDKAQTHCHWIRDLHKRDIPLTDYLDAESALGIQYTYDTPGWKGYAGKFSPEVLHRIRSSPEVAYVEKDSMMYASELQRNAPWGLARISHREPINLKTFSKYLHDSNAGEGVKVFVIDTGINHEHVDFEGRASWGVSIPGDGDVDGNGHGSHCAGTIAGKRFGVAKKAEPVAVKVLGSNGSGSTSWVLAGINWAIEQHQIDAAEAEKKGKKYKGSVANMSLGGGKSRALDNAVDEAVRRGMVFAVAAGNDNRDACKYSPAASPLAITVGASNIADARAYFSNFGECVDVFAPGENIQSVWNTNKYSTNTISGTSMASPHVAGLAAYYLSQEEGNNVDPKIIKDKIIQLATRNALSNIPSDTPNLLIFNNFEA